MMKCRICGRPGLLRGDKSKPSTLQKIHGGGWIRLHPIYREDLCYWHKKTRKLWDKEK